LSQDSNVSEPTLSRPPLVLILCGLVSLRWKYQQCLILHSFVDDPPLLVVRHHEWQEDLKVLRLNLLIAAWTAAHNVRGFGKFLVILSKEKGMAIEPSKCVQDWPSHLVVKKMSNIITIRVPVGLSFAMSVTLVRPERILPFLPPGFSEASRI